MNATSALLRVAARATGASAAFLVRRSDQGLVAAWPADAVPSGQPATTRAFRVRLADGGDADAIFVGADRDPSKRCRAILAEIGRMADADAEGSVELARLADMLEIFADAASLIRVSASLDEPSLYLCVNAAFTRLLGFSSEDVAARPVSLLWGAETAEDRIRFVRQRMIDGQPVTAVLAFYTKDRAPVWLETTVSPLGAGYFISMYRDVTHRRQFEESLASQKRKLQTTLAAIADAVITVLDDGRVEFINAAAQTLLDIDIADAYGEHLDAVVQLVDADDAPIDILGGAKAGHPFRGDGRLPLPKGTLDVAFVASRVDGENGSVIVLRDVTAEHRLASRLSFEATHDPLTGLPNRRAFIERLESAVHDAHQHSAHACVAFLDLDRFKIVNDRFGHAVGDRLLKEIGKVMGRVVRGADVLARIGGDEFALLLMDCKPDDARRVAEKMRKAVDGYRIVHEGEMLSVGVSIGIAAVDAATTSGSQALEDADAACYQAKAAGRNAVAG